MSSFAGLSTALSSLIAQRQALEVTGQNIANANTPGYTRQRAEMSSVSALAAPSMFSSQNVVGNGVRVTGITRMGDIFLDNRLHTETAEASFQAARADALGRLESTIAEPSDTGVAAGLQKFWAGWQSIANSPDDIAARKVLLGDARALVSQISSGYTAAETQWEHTRTEAGTLVTEINSAAQGVAHLNEQIRSILVSGGSANELIDQRDRMVTELSAMVGASARHRDDGTVDVMVGGNALVRGVEAKEILIAGANVMQDALGGNHVTLTWAETGTPLSLDGGRLAASMADLGPNGVLIGTAAQWDAVATALRDQVNAVHTTGMTLDDPPVAAGDFFSIGAGPAAKSLTVAITDPVAIAAGAPGQGAFDGSIADTISQLATADDGPDEVFRNLVVDLGVQTRAATQRATVTESVRATSENLQLANASVDLDEESINMLAYQRAYEGAARVLTAIDEMLDVLINRTGVVGR